VAPERIRILHNTVRSYDWGSYTEIAELLGAPSPSVEPQAELWIGAHPNAPSRVVTEEGEIPLDEWIARDPERVLGSNVAARFGKLPFLLKVLAAERPLSIQAHPSLEQARTGFDRENAAGIPLDAPERCYKDDNHKPELIYALTPFSALSRFREIAEIAASFELLAARELEEAIAVLQRDSESEGLPVFLRALLTRDAEVREAVVDRARKVAADRGEADPRWRWVQRLAELYPADPGALAPLFLNLVTLEPGQAMYLPSGELHCYLGGTGVEIMASSDNVLRGGLTAKRVDVGELISALTFCSAAIERVAPVQMACGGERFVTAAEEFALSVHRTGEGEIHEVLCDQGAEVLLCTEGAVRICSKRDGTATSLKRGSSAFVPAEADGYRIEGQGTLYRASAGI
jgi:mannose-6-phosphate isomerase